MLTLPQPSRSRTEHNDDLQIWTASRCNRLLRQISSRLAHLRQLVMDVSETKRSRKRAPGGQISEPQQKRVRRTYGGRKKNSMPLKERNSNISTPPRIMRALGTMRPDVISSPAHRCCPTPIRPADVQQKATCPDTQTHHPDHPEPRIRRKVTAVGTTDLSQLSASAPPEHLKIYQAILLWLARLLQATKEQQHETSHKSLLGMCLRRVPDCLDAIDAWDHREAKNIGPVSMWKTDEAANTIYGQLEDFGGSGGDWTPFKHLVRSHAIQILSQAVMEGLFIPEFVALMARMCVQRDCAEEADRLLSACRRMVLASHLRDQSDLAPSHAHEICNRAVVEICAGDTPASSFLPVVGAAISGQELLVGEILPKHLSNLWRTSLAIVQESLSPHLGIRLLVPTLEALTSSDANGPWSYQDDKGRLLTSLTAGIAAAAMTTATSQDQRRHIYILEAAVNEVTSKRTKNREAQHCGLFLLMMARQLALEADKTAFVELRVQGREDLESLIARSDFQALYHQTIALSCSIAHACSRGVARPSHEILDELCMSLNQIPLPSWFIDGLRSEGAFMLAQKTKDLRDLAFAENLSQTGHAGTSQAAASSMFSGWRWEAGISEWVLPSPSEKGVAKGLSRETIPDGLASNRPERQAKRALRKGPMSKERQAKPRPRGVDVDHATNQISDSGALQYKPHGANVSARTHYEESRQRNPQSVQSCEAVDLHQQRRASMSSACTKDDPCMGRSTVVDSNGNLSFASITRTCLMATEAEDEDAAVAEFRRSSEVKATCRKGNLVRHGVHGLDVMRAAAPTATSKVVRRKSGTAVSCMRRQLSVSDSRAHRRRTTVSLSSLAMWPGSDDWDELL